HEVPQIAQVFRSRGQVDRIVPTSGVDGDVGAAAIDVDDVLADAGVKDELTDRIVREGLQYCRNEVQTCDGGVVDGEDHEGGSVALVIEGQRVCPCPSADRQVRQEALEVIGR